MFVLDFQWLSWNGKALTSFAITELIANDKKQQNVRMWCEPNDNLEHPNQLNQYKQFELERDWKDES